MNYLYQTLVAKNDNNGNPRRLGVVYCPGGNVYCVYHVYDEGRHGRPDDMSTYMEMPMVEISVRHYNYLCSEYGAK